MTSFARTHLQEDSDYEEAKAEWTASGEEADYDADAEQPALSADQMRGVHGRIDSDRDGRVSLAELLAFSEAIRQRVASREAGRVFRAMDHDRDGRLVLEEFVRHIDQDRHEDLEAAKFRIADSNGDGHLDDSELPALFMHNGILELSAKWSLEQLDADEDGLLSPQEFRSRGAQYDEDGEADDTQDVLADFRKLDSDGSGRVSAAELVAWESGRFHAAEALGELLEIADRDGDQHVSVEELVEAREEIATTDAQGHLIEWSTWTQHDEF